MIDYIFKIFIFFVISGMFGLVCFYIIRFFEKSLDNFSININILNVIRIVSLSLVQIGFLGTALIFFMALI